MLILNDLTVGYGKRHLIENVITVFRSGTLTALIGRNGAGKSSLIRVLAGLDAPQSGGVELDGRNIESMSTPERAKHIAMVTTRRVRIPDMRCYDVVAMGRAPYTGWTGALSETDRQIVHNALKMTGMQDYAQRSLDSLSDGECQRVMIARAIAQDTPVILLDEPTSFLDLPNRYELCRLLKALAHEQGKCIVFSTHELDIALNLCDYIALIDSPRLINLKAEEMARSGNIKRLFGELSDIYIRR